MIHWLSDQIMCPDLVQDISTAVGQPKLFTAARHIRQNSRIIAVIDLFIGSLQVMCKPTDEELFQQAERLRDLSSGISRSFVFCQPAGGVRFYDHTAKMISPSFQACDACSGSHSPVLVRLGLPRSSAIHASRLEREDQRGLIHVGVAHTEHVMIGLATFSD